MEMHHLGSGIWSQMRLSTGAILSVTVPATIMRSLCRGLGRKTSAPKRAISKREALAAIISMAQHARPKVSGQMDDSRAQLNTWSTLVVTIFCSNWFWMNEDIQLSSAPEIVALRRILSLGGRRFTSQSFEAEGFDGSDAGGREKWQTHVPCG